jgi:glycosyltransferase involved in cell wall biosynthesis
VRIDIVTETFPPEVNGVATTLARFVDGLAARGHTIRVLRPRQDRDPHEAAAVSGRGYPEVLLRGMPIPRYPQLRLGLPAPRAMRRVWEAEVPAIVHIATEGPLGWSALRTARAMGLVVTSDFRTHFDAYSAHYGIGWLRRPIASYLRRFHNGTAATMVPTRALRDRLAQGGFERLSVVGRGIDTTLFDPARRSEALRARWGAGPGTPVVLHVGRLAPEKNPMALGATFDSIRRHAPRARLVLVGDGPDQDEARRIARARGFCDRVTFLGMRDALPELLAPADVFCLASTEESFGLSALEAMACAVPVLVRAWVQSDRAEF